MQFLICVRVWDIPTKQKSLLLSQTETGDFAERVPLSYACYETFHKEWKERDNLNRQQPTLKGYAVKDRV